MVLPPSFAKALTDPWLSMRTEGGSVTAQEGRALKGA